MGCHPIEELYRKIKIPQAIHFYTFSKIKVIETLKAH